MAPASAIGSHVGEDVSATLNSRLAHVLFFYQSVSGGVLTGAATYVDSLLPWEDAHGISYVGWTWNAWGDSSNILIADYTGTPTANFGQKFHDHLVGLNP